VNLLLGLRTSGAIVGDNRDAVVWTDIVVELLLGLRL
jgi:hypothetical protein